MVRRISLLFCAGLVLLFAFPGSPKASQESASESQVVLNGYQAIIDEHLRGVLAGLKALAATEDVTSGNWQRMRAPLAEFGKVVPTDAAIWFARADGSYLTVEQGDTNQNLKDRDYFSSLLRKQDVVGSLVVSKSTGERSIIVAAPVVKGGRVIGALGATISAAKLASRVSDEMALPDNVICYALDKNGLTALHRDVSLIFEFPSDIGDQSLKFAVQEMLSKQKGVVHYMFRGSARTVQFQRSDLTGWIIALGKVNSE